MLEARQEGVTRYQTVQMETVRHKLQQERQNAMNAKTPKPIMSTIRMFSILICMSPQQKPFTWA